MSKKKSLDIYLGEVFKQFIAIKDDDYKRSQDVFMGVFEQIKQNMGVQCNYFKKYSSQVLFAGSVYDGIKVTKLDEFDMDLVIRLPISYDPGENGVIITNDRPGFITLRITKPFDNLDKQPEWEKCHKVTREWRDDSKYFLQNKFRQWMHGIVQKAVNDMEYKVTVAGVIYTVSYKESGPAYTLNVRGEETFALDVDLVPVVRFPDKRWPEGYRRIEELGVSVTPGKYWLAVPKPNKCQTNETLRNRSWRLSFHEYERDMIKDCQQLKMTIRLIKKLRDRLEMKAIASYYIKTLFLWKVHDMKDKSFWQKKVSVLFQLMIEELYNAIKEKNIPYFWHKGNNLIETLKPTLQNQYMEKLKSVLDAIESNSVDKIVAFLLTPKELAVFKKSEFYQKQLVIVTLNREDSVKSVQSSKSDDKDEIIKNLERKIEELMVKVDDLTDKVYSQEERLKVLEMNEVKNGNVVVDDMLLLDGKSSQLEDTCKNDPLKPTEMGEMIFNLIKKLRDRLEIKAIMKTLVLWKLNELKGNSFWQKKVRVLFQLMIEELYSAIKEKNIPNFPKQYMEKLKSVLDAIESNSVDKIVAFLLKPNELAEFKKSNFYQKHLQTITFNKEDYTKSDDKYEIIRDLEQKVEVLTDIVDDFTDKVNRQEERLNVLEINGDTLVGYTKSKL